MNGARYIPDQKAWLLPTDGADCEVLVVGDTAAPDATRLALTRQAIGNLTDLRKRAAAYLDEFVDRKKFAAASQWNLEGLECGLGGQAVDQFSLSFSLEGDTYGKWSVTFRLSSGKYFPVAFERIQI